MAEGEVYAGVSLGNFPAQFFIDNASHVLDNGQLCYLSDDSGLYKKGDGTRTIGALPWLGGSSSSGTVQSVNNVQPDVDGNVQIDANDVGADPSGSAAAVQNELDTHEANTSNPHNVTKAQVGLSNVDNTSDVNKPVSNAQQTALNLKADITSLYLPPIANVVYLVGTSGDQTRMGGTANRVYITLQAAYDAAVAIGGSVNIMIGNTTAAQVGNLILTTNWSSNIKLVGTSPVISTVGNITGSNASGTGFGINTTFHNLTIGTITSSATGTTGNSGLITLQLNNVKITSITTNITNASNTSGIGGAVTIGPNSTGTINNVSYINLISTTGANNSNSESGTVAILGGALMNIGTVTTSNNLSVGGAVTINDCNFVGIINGAYGGLTINNCDRVNTITSKASIVSIFNSVLFNNSAFTAVEEGGLTIGGISCYGSFTYTNSQFVGVDINNSYFNGNVSLNNQITVTTILASTFKLNLRLTASSSDSSLSQAIVTDSSVLGTLEYTPDLSILKNCTINTIFSIGEGCSFIKCMLNGLNSNNIPLLIETSFPDFAGEDGYMASGIGEYTVTKIFYTEDATPTVFDLTTGPFRGGQSCRIIMDVLASTGDLSVMTGSICRLFRRDTGGGSSSDWIGASPTIIIPTISEAALSGASFDFVNNGFSPSIELTGIAAQVKWVITFRIFSDYIYVF